MPYRDGQGLCPRCGAPLHGDARAQCAGCGGSFVGFAALLESHGGLTALLGMSPTSTPQTPLRCPRCNDVMRAVTVTTVVLDFCATHGVWFDTRELERLARSLRP
jgi:hypothetical protein